jgi:hypothetical protein
LRYAREPDDEGRPADYVAEIEQVLADLLQQEYVIGPDADPTYIYTSSQGIDRAEAERMLLFFLKRRLGIACPKLKWNRLKSDSAIFSMAFGSYDS